MSASEKLKALDGTIHGVAGIYPPETIESLCAALPQIVAVVKAAEKSAHSDDAGYLTGLSPHPTPCAYCAALSALDEELS